MALHCAQPDGQTAQSQYENGDVKRGAHGHQKKCECLLRELRNGCDDFLQIHGLSLIERVQK